MMRRNGFLFIPLLFFFFSTNITPEKWLSYITFLFSNVSQKIDSFVQKAYIHRIAPSFLIKSQKKYIAPSCQSQQQSLLLQKNKSMVAIRKATKEQAPEIARLIMMAMTHECCQHFCGEGHGLEDFRHMMTMLVEREDSQYSYKNTIVALDGDRVAGIAVSYDGSQLHPLRQAFVEMARKWLNKDHSGMDDETQVGELYLDSLAVLPTHRRQGNPSR